MSNYQIPFRNGNQLSYDDGWINNPVEWRDNFEFEATMKIDGIHRGRSAANFRLKDVDTGKEYSMFMKDVWNMINTKTISNGNLSGKWTFCKRGSNYGIKPV